MFFKRKNFRLHAHQYSKFNLSYKSRAKFSLREFAASGAAALKKNKSEILAFLFVALFAWAGLQSARISAIALEVRQKIFSGAGAGVGYLDEAKEALKNQDLSRASENFSLSLKNFRASQKELETLEKNLLGATKLIPQKKDADNLLKASISLAEAGQALVSFGSLASHFSFGAEGLLRGGVDFKDLSAQLEIINARLSEASDFIEKTKLNNLPADTREKITGNLEKINDALSASQILRQPVALGQTFFTGQKQILLLMQNNNELRPSGGFPGSFGAIKLASGKIEYLKISSIYDLDGQLGEKIRPPGPVLAVNDRWFLRDANWFASFDKSAEKTISFYEKEGGETPDLVIALTPSLISELMKITGPLKIEGREDLNSENLQERLQVLTQSDPADPSNEPKKILGSLYTQLFQTLGSLEPAQKIRALDALQKSLSAKQLLFYTKDSKARKIFDSFNCSGKILPADRDYLLISAANLGGTKTDLVIKQQISLSSSISRSGQTTNTLVITRSNTMPDVPGAENKSFIRVFAPLGSKLLKAEGFDRVELPRPDGEGYKTDSDVLKWEKT